MNSAWYEEQPSQAYKARVLKSAAREIEHIQSSRRFWLRDLFNSWNGLDIGLTAGWATGFAAIVAVWLSTRQSSLPISGQADALKLANHELDLDVQKVSLDEFQLVAELDLLEDLDLLEELSDEDFASGERDS